MKNFRLFFLFCATGTAVVVSPLPGYCYVGPGAGITLLGSLWAAVAAVITAIAGIVLLVIRALFRLRRRSKGSATDSGP